MCTQEVLILLKWEFLFEGIKPASVVTKKHRETQHSEHLSRMRSELQGDLIWKIQHENQRANHLGSGSSSITSYKCQEGTPFDMLGDGKRRAHAPHKLHVTGITTQSLLSILPADRADQVAVGLELGTRGVGGRAPQVPQFECTASYYEASPTRGDLHTQAIPAEENSLSFFWLASNMSSENLASHLSFKSL